MHIAGRALLRINQAVLGTEAEMGTARPFFLLAEGARSECASSMRAVKNNLTAPPHGNVEKRQALDLARGMSWRASGLMGKKVSRSGKLVRPDS